MLRRTLMLALAALALASGGAVAQGRWGGGGHGGAPAGGGWHGGGNWHGDGGWHGGGHGDWHGGHGGWYGSFYFGGPYWGWGFPYYAYPYPYAYYGYPYAYRYYDYPYRYDGYPDAAYAPSAPTVYVERAPRAPASDWYYCTDPAGYYPYVTHCSKPWMRVAPQSVPSGPSVPAPSPRPPGGSQ